MRVVQTLQPDVTHNDSPDAGWSLLSSHFPPNSFFTSLKPKLKLKHKPSQSFQAHLFSLAYMLLMQGGWRDEKRGSVTHFICFILTNGRHDVYHVTMVVLQ